MDNLKADEIEERILDLETERWQALCGVQESAGEKRAALSRRYALLYGEIEALYRSLRQETGRVE